MQSSEVSRAEPAQGPGVVSEHGGANLTTRLNGLVVQDSGFEFTAKNFDLLRGPIVYAFFDDEFPVYVGMSTVGISRPARPDHHVMRAEKYDRVRIWACPSVQAARELEKLLTETLEPRKNIRFSATSQTRIARHLGIGTSAIRSGYGLTRGTSNQPRRRYSAKIGFDGPLGLEVRSDNFSQWKSGGKKWLKEFLRK